MLQASPSQLYLLFLQVNVQQEHSELSELMGDFGLDNAKGKGIAADHAIEQQFAQSEHDHQATQGGGCHADRRDCVAALGEAQLPVIGLCCPKSGMGLSGACSVVMQTQYDSTKLQRACLGGPWLRVTASSAIVQRARMARLDTSFCIL